MKIFVKTYTGKIIPFDVEPDDATETIKAKIQNSENTLVSQQRLIFDGKVLEDERTIAESGITEESIIYLVVRLRAVV